MRGRDEFVGSQPTLWQAANAAGAAASPPPAEQNPGEVLAGGIPQGGGGDGRAPLPRSPAAASWPGREAGEARARWPAPASERWRAGSERVCPRPTPAGAGRRQRPGGTPPGGRRSRPLARPCQAWATSRAAGARGGERGQMAVDKGTGESGMDKGMVEPPAPPPGPLPPTTGCWHLAPEPWAGGGGLGTPGGAAAGRGWERGERDGREKGEQGREGERKKKGRKK